MTAALHGLVLAFASGAAAQPSCPTITWAPFTLEVSGVGSAEGLKLRVPLQPFMGARR